MVREDNVVPTGAELVELMNQKDYLSLIRDWREVIFHTVFVKKGEALELPMLLEVHGNHLAVSGHRHRRKTASG